MTQPSPERPGASPHVQYKGADLEPARGPGLGCFWVQVVLLLILVVLTPLSVSLGWPTWIPIVLLFVTLGLLFFVGQTMIFLLRIVAAERGEGRRKPRASRSMTVGQLEDQADRAPASDGPAQPPSEPLPTRDGTPPAPTA